MYAHLHHVREERGSNFKCSIDQHMVCYLLRYNVSGGGEATFLPQCTGEEARWQSSEEMIKRWWDRCRCSVESASVVKYSWVAIFSRLFMVWLLEMSSWYDLIKATGGSGGSKILRWLWTVRKCVTSFIIARWEWRFYFVSIVQCKHGVNHNIINKFDDSC